MELLKQLYGVYSPSENEKRMRKFIRRWIAANVPDADMVTDVAGNLLVVRGACDTYPCVVAHMDQVQDLHSKDFVTLDSHGVLMGYSPKNHRQEGLGADDKNGVWVALRCLEKYSVMKCAFFVGEEVGCIGSGKVDMAFFSDCRFVLQCDRRNAHDLITDVWGRMASDEFIMATGYAEYGYAPTKGAMTDVATLHSRGLAVSVLNISCGYYEPHTDCEFTVFAELVNCLGFVCHVIENCTEVYGFGPTPEPDEWPDEWQTGAAAELERAEMEWMMEGEIYGYNFSPDNFYMETADLFPHIGYADYMEVYEKLNKYKQF